MRLISMIMIIGLFHSCCNIKLVEKERHANVSNEDENLNHILKTVRKNNLPIDSVIALTGSSKILFDGRKWNQEKNSEYFKIHSKSDKLNNKDLNISANYLIYKLASSDLNYGRVKGIIIYWKNNEVIDSLVEVENFNAER